MSSPSRMSRILAALGTLLRRGIVLIVVLLLAAVGGYFGYQQVNARAKVQRDAVEKLEKLGGEFTYDYQWKWKEPVGWVKNDEGKPLFPEAIISQLGIDFFHSVYGLKFPREIHECEAAFTALPSLRFIELNEFDSRTCSLKPLKNSPYVTWLTLHNCKFLAESDMEIIASLGNLQELTVTGPVGNDSLLTKLTRLHRLRRLTVQGTEISDEGLLGIGQLHDLADLILIDSSITDEGLKQIATVHGMKLLEIRSQNSRSQLSATALSCLSELTNLRRLEIQKAPLDAASLKSLKEMTKLEHLGLSGSQVSGETLDALAGMPKLATVDLSDTPVSDADLPRLSAIKRLSRLNLAGAKIFDAGVKSWTPPKLLASLDLSRTAIGDESLKHLQSWNSLKQLHIRQTQVTQSGVTALQGAQPGCTIEHSFAP